MKRNYSYVWWGAGITALYLIAVIALSAFHSTSFDDLEPNSWADFLSGIFAPLAFLWLVLGFFQQGQELRNSAEALRLQGEELRASVEQQEQLVRVSREQLEFEREQLQAERDEAARLAQPDFALIAGSRVTGLRKFSRTNVILLNRGRPCTDVYVVAANETAAREPFMSTGDKLEFEIELDWNTEEGWFPIDVRFVDFMGRSGQAALGAQLIKDASGSPYLNLS